MWRRSVLWKNKNHKDKPINWLSSQELLMFNYLRGFELFPCDFPSRFESLIFESVSLPSMSLPSASSMSSGSMSFRSFTANWIKNSFVLIFKQQSEPQTTIRDVSLQAEKLFQDFNYASIMLDSFFPAAFSREGENKQQDDENKL